MIFLYSIGSKGNGNEQYVLYVPFSLNITLNQPGIVGD
jgi:hypothetical protein